MQIIEPDNWCPLAGIELESDASRAIRTEGNVLVVAGPGSGKTELLAQKADYLLRTNLCPPPKKILAISFKKDAAKNLKERIVNRSGKDLAIRIDSLTYDAFAKQLLDQFREVLPKSIRPDQDYVILTNTNQIKQMLQETEYLKFWNTDLHQAEKTLLNNIIKAIKKERIILPEKIYKQIFHREIKPYTNLTFSLITLLVIYILHHNTYILRALRHTYKYVFLDEFQDTTDLQYNLVKKSFCNSSTQVTAVGDNKQRIMLWAGARETVFQDFERDFSARTLYLLMNHRSAPKLVALQKSMYQSLCDDGERNIETSSKWKANDGKVSLWIFNDEKDEAYHLAKNIVEKIKMVL
ncbi:UvrD-helicase domain-containing protein [Mitsuokella sp. WILCCON 0060]|uniref:UvrD-helicase domain-containing protein n=1 Tax=Mitsuokella sp. WILCCON 0060 TaxID=3345341 RepID=UPI003F1B057D